MPTDPKREQAVFLAAVGLEAAADRPALLDRECGNDPDLRARVEALLRAHDAPDSLPEPDPPTDGAATLAYEDQTALHDPTRLGAVQVTGPLSEGPGTRIGPYRLIQQIGEGGMGTVFVAEQERPVKRRVAVKVIKPGMDSRQVIARFEAERQALAILDHPNIAKVLDAGTTDAGRPYFVMELVKGVPITDYCDTVHLTPKERLSLFLPVCAAIQHAHQKGIIHRDVKPSNVLIMMQDGKPVPKVIDFGIAKAIDQKLTERSLFTDHGAIVGTLEYMSPEQAEMSALDVDTRTDIYALGVLLYELLTGSTPLERARLRRAGYAEILKRIKEEEPPKPSMRLSESGESLPSIAALRKTEPVRLTKLVRGDLDWIVMKALEKDRTRRYETANGFARDIQRHLDGDAVEACPPSARYKLGKFARKHRAVLATIGSFALLLMTATAISSWLTVRARHAERLAKERLTRALTAEAEARTQAQLARTQQQRAEDRESLAIDAVKRFRDAVAGEPKLKNTPELDGLRKRLLKEPLGFFRALRDRLAADRDTRADSLPRLADASFDLGRLTDEIGDKQDALIAYHESLAIKQKLADANPTVTEFQSGLATIHTNIAVLLRDTGKPAEAMKAHESAMAILRKLADANHTIAEFQRNLAGNHMDIGNLLRDTGRRTEALEAYESAIAILRKLVDANPTDAEFQRTLAGSHLGIGNLLLVTGKPAEALNAYARALEIFQKVADANPTVTDFQQNLAVVYLNIGNQLRDTGKPAEALESYRSGLTIMKRLADANPTITRFQRNVAASHGNIGVLLWETRRPAEALAAHASALAIFQKLADANPTDVNFQRDLATTHINISNALRDIGKPAEARNSSESALAILQRLADANPTVPEFQLNLANSYHNIGIGLHDTGKSAEALKAYEKALAVGQKLAEEHPELTHAASALGGTLNDAARVDLDASRFEEARVRLRQAIEWQRKALAGNPSNPTYRQRLGNHLKLLSSAARGLGDSDGVTAAERELATLRDSDPAMVALDVRLAAIIKGDQQPRNEADRLALAQRAYDKALHATATRLWADALAAEPKLGDDRQATHRYNAACAAALAASGQGKDDPRPDDDARVKLRAQALGWLKDELSAWKRVAKTVGSGNQELVAKTFAHWKADSDLSTIRDEKELAKLPEGERAQFAGLWADVDALLIEVARATKSASCFGCTQKRNS
jgi:serine/threonine protein kinase/tetratricopeptide (TPR) repeat protein